MQIDRFGAAWETHYIEENAIDTRDVSNPVPHITKKVLDRISMTLLRL